jgi:cobalt-zinc-cadmium efflux system membrane fusion protein
MKRILIMLPALAMTAALAGALLQMSSRARTLLAWTSLPGLGKTGSTQAEPAVAKETALSKSEWKNGKGPPGAIDMSLEQIAVQGIELAAAGWGVIAQTISIPGTVTLDPGRVARVPGRVVGTVTQMRKRLGDPVTQGEVVAVLDSRKVADAKSE